MPGLPKDISPKFIFSLLLKITGGNYLETECRFFFATYISAEKYLYVGFMCHQVVEKILKSYYIFVKNQTPPYTHNLYLLAKECNIFELLSEEQVNTIDILRPLNIEARYPAHKEKLFQSLTEERCKKIINQTEELFLWIKTKLS